MPACRTLLCLLPIISFLGLSPRACGEELPAGMKRLLDRLPQTDRAFLARAPYCGQWNMAQLVTYTTDDLQLRADFHIPDNLARHLPGTDPVLVAIEGSPHLWSLHRSKSGTLDEQLSLVILTCYAPEIVWPFNRFTIASDGKNVMVSAAQMFGQVGFQPQCTLKQGQNSLHLSYRIEEDKFKPKRIDILDISMLPTRAADVFDKYLVPALRRLGPARPASDVYRVFDQIPADPEVTRKILPLVQKLGSANSGTREAALKALSAMGRPAVLAALRLDRAELSPEQAARLAAFYAADGWFHIADFEAARKDEVFLTDCQEDEDKAVRSAASSALTAIRATRNLH